VGDGLEGPDDAPYETTGYARICSKEGLKLVNFSRQGYVSVPVAGCYAVSPVPIASVAAGADFVITVPKWKTHMLTLVTGAVKNNYGYLPHEVKLRLHREQIVPADFAGAVVDVYAACPPGFVVVDAIDALEGSGPSRGGRPRHLGLLIAGTDAVAVDAVCSASIGLDPMQVATTRLAHQRGLGTGDLSDIEVAGSSIQEARCEDFARPANQYLLGPVADRLPRGVRRMMSRVLRRTRQWPRVRPEKCTGCGVCATHCPQDAIEIEHGKAQIHYDECISCFCCLEFCPSDALRPDRSLSGKCLAMGIRLLSRAAQAPRRIFRKS